MSELPRDDRPATARAQPPADPNAVSFAEFVASTEELRDGISRGNEATRREIRNQTVRAQGELGTGLIWIGVQVVIAGWMLGGKFFGPTLRPKR
jgi:hypothetical protein